MTAYIDVTLPVLYLKINGELSRFKKPTGLENLILTAIGTPALNSETWRSFLMRLAVPESMAPLFERVVSDLYDNEVVDSYRFSLDSKISELGFTDTGKDLFEQGRIKQTPRQFSTDAYFVPYSKDPGAAYRFEQKTSTLTGFDKDKFRGVTYNPDNLKKYLSHNKKNFGADEDEEILSMELEEEPLMLCSTERMRLDFDETSGDFSFSVNADSNFIKGYFASDDFLKYIKLLFIPNNITLLKTQPVPEEWISYRYSLPSDFEFKGILKAFNPEFCNSNNAFSLSSLKYHFADINDNKTGRGFIFTEKALGVTGLEGRCTSVVIVSRPLSKEEIEETLKDCVTSTDISEYDNLKSLLALTPVSDDSEFQSKLISSHLTETENLADSVHMLVTDNASFRLRPRALEEAFCKRKTELNNAADIAKSEGLKLSCIDLAEMYRTDDSNKTIEIFDKLIPICNSVSALSVKMNVADTLVEMISSGKTGEYSSRELITVNTLSNALSNLKKIFRVESPSKYDISDITDDDSRKILGEYETASKSMIIVYPIIRNSKKYEDLENYLNLFQNLSEIYSEDVPLERLLGPFFGAAIRKKMEKILREMTGTSGKIVDLVDRAYDLKYIDSKTRDVLHEIRDYGNKCVHPTDVQPVNKATRERWIAQVNELEKQLRKNQ